MLPLGEGRLRKDRGELQREIQQSNRQVDGAGTCHEFGFLTTEWEAEEIG